MASHLNDMRIKGNRIFLFALIFLTLVFGYRVLPWWSIYVIPLVATFVFGTATAKEAVWVSAIAAFIAWTGLSYVLASNNSFVMVTRIGKLFGDTSALTLLLITGVLGAFYASLGGYLGFLLSEKINTNR